MMDVTWPCLRVISRGRDMINYMGMLKEFHKTFNCFINNEPTVISNKNALGRLRLIHEETSELIEAMAKEDLINIADALADLLYVVFGTALGYGLPMDKIFELVHKSNMTKVGGYHDEAGKFIKPATYKPVNLNWLKENYNDA